MSQTPVPASPERLKQLLSGYPAHVMTHAVDYSTTRNLAALDQLVLEVLAFHLPPRPEGKPNVTALPGSTRLVADLMVDSLAMVEMSFLLEDVTGVRLQPEELRAVMTLDDLKSAIRAKATAAA